MLSEMVHVKENLAANRKDFHVVSLLLSICFLSKSFFIYIL